MAIQLYEDELAGTPSGDSSLMAPPSSGIGIAPPPAPMPASGGASGGGDSGGMAAQQESPGVWQSIKESFLPVARAKDRRMKEQQVKNQQLTSGINALKEGLELSLGVEGDQRATFVQAYKTKLDAFEAGLGAAFENLVANPEAAGSIVQWGEESETLKRALQAGGIKGAKKLLTSPEALKTIQAEIDTKRMPLLLRKGQTFIAGWQQIVPPEMAEQIKKDGRVSASELISANEWIKTNKPDLAKTLAFTDRDLEVVGRNSEAFYHSLGIVSPKDEGAILVDQAKGEKGKPPPSRNKKKTVAGKVVDQPQTWDGQKWVDDGDATPHFKPKDTTGPGEIPRDVMDMELKVGDDYSRDAKKFSERRPLFDSATDYVAKRGANGENKTSAGDAALMFAYAKMRDPNDRLAVSETRDLVKLGNIFERFKVSVEGVLNKGETLPDRVAKEMYDEIRRAFVEQNKQQAGIEKQYREKVKSYGGNPDRVVRSHAIPENELNPPKDAEPSQADLEHTAKVHGITVEEVKKRLKAKKK